jgi:chaperonin GroEL
MRKYDNGPSLKDKILKGVNVLADNVASTLGPRGKSVVLKDNGNPIITKDGVTVAKFIELEDPFENLGAQIVKQASEQTNIVAGDGTTTATVLARAILQESQKHLVAGHSPVELKKGMDKAVAKIVENLKGIAKPISSEEDIRHVATISANGDEAIGNLIAMAVDCVGKNGSITIQEGRSIETSLDVVEGFRFNSGFTSNSFITDERKGVMRYDNPFILVTDYKVENIEDILPVLEVVAREGRPVVFVVEDIEGQALAAMIMNSVRGTMKVAAIKAPQYGEERRSILKDLSISVGATFFSRETGLALKDAKLEHLGQAKTIESSKVGTTIVGGFGDAEEVEERIDILKQEISGNEDIQSCKSIQERITRLASGIAIVNVGAPTEIEMIEKKHRIEDALEAVKSAQQEGVVPGGGIALLKAAGGLLKEMGDITEGERAGVSIILNSVYEPFRQMVLNAEGDSPEVILKQIEGDGPLGYNVATGEVVNMFDAGILDPAKVTRVALQNASSVSSTLITTNYAIVSV